MDERGHVSRDALLLWIDASIRRPSRLMLSASLVLTSLLMPLGAHAGLGDPAASVVEDGATLGAETRTATTMPSYVRHDMTTGDGTRIREFASSDGVFAVAFDGPTMPDLKTMLGAHYDGYVAAARAHRGSHHVVSFESDGAVVTIMKLQRGFSGSAQLPASTPRGINVQDLR